MGIIVKKLVETGEYVEEDEVTGEQYLLDYNDPRIPSYDVVLPEIVLAVTDNTTANATAMTALRTAQEAVITQKRTIMNNNGIPAEKRYV